MRWARLTVRATWKKPRTIRDQYLEKMAMSRTRSLLSLGNNNQLTTRPNALSKPEAMKVNRHPPQSASTATAGTLITDASMTTASRAPTAQARLSGDMTSEIAPTKLGGNVPAPRPVNTRSTRNTSILGANADPNSGPAISNNPARAMGPTQQPRYPRPQMLRSPTDRRPPPIYPDQSISPLGEP